MQPAEIFRAAADMIRNGGHSQGFHARDAQGNGLALFGNTRSGEEVDVSRAEVNPAAVSFSIYGALAAAMRKGGGDPGVIWTTAAQEAERSMIGLAVPGGTNHLHPVHLLNEHEGTDKEAAIAFLERCAVLVEPKKAAEVANGS